MFRHGLFYVGGTMSIRIETLEQLQDPKILENVLDRLRRTTRPRPFAFKKRCKALGDIPLLLTAPPGRKIKSSLLRSLRLGTPTQKGVVHREGQRLIFTFTTPVNASDTARWIAKCMHNAKSPVPLKCIEIRQPNEDSMDNSTMNPPSYEAIDTNRLELETPLFEGTCESLPPIDPDLDASESINIPSLATSDEVQALLIKHTSSKKIKWLRETAEIIQSLENRINQMTLTIEELEEQLYGVELSIESFKHQLKNTKVVPKQNPWTSLFETCQATNWSLDEIRLTLDTAKVNTLPLLKDLQFLSDDDEMSAYTLVREYCKKHSHQWAETCQSPEWHELHNQHQDSQDLYTELCTELNRQQAILVDLETQQETLEVKYDKRWLEVWEKLQVHLKK